MLKIRSKPMLPAASAFSLFGKKIPVVFHNLKHYDSYLIMQGVGKIKDHKIDVIATNMEKYISFSLSQQYDKVHLSLQFIDSLQFLNASLDQLVKSLAKEELKILNENIQHPCLDLLLKKGVYPYEYISSFSKFEETCLPLQEEFFSSLTDSSISAEEYQHAQAVWQAFSIENLGQYHNLYVKSDVLQLADARTSPGLAWQASLKMLQRPLELFTVIDMHLFIERGIRGGISTITHRWAEANNKYLPNYDPSKPSSYITYLEANNLYGWAMSQHLPHGNFNWISPENIDIHDILSLPADSPQGYILEVDIDYPKELHDLHNDYPLALEKLTVGVHDLSSLSIFMIKDVKYSGSTKLIPNLKPKTNYVAHYRNLQLYLKLGLKIIGFIKCSNWINLHG